MADDHQYGDEGRPPIVKDVTDAVNAIGMVNNVTESVGRATVDFSLGKSEAEGLTLLEQAKGGRFGSGLVVDTTNEEITNGTLRLGALGLPEGADLFLAVTEIEQVAMDADPPVGVSSLDGEEPIYVRFRDMTGMKHGGTLRSEGTDIVHVVINGRVPVGPTLEWMKRFVRMYEKQKPRILERVRELGVNR